MMRNRQEQRRASFKKGIDADDSRRKREEQSTSIRKSKREESLMKRRMVPSQQTTEAANEIAPTTKMIPAMLAKLLSNNIEEAFEATVQFRKLLSVERNPPINEVIKSGAVQRLVQFLGATSNDRLQFEAAWALTNIASGTADQTAYVVDQGAVPAFVQLLSHPHGDVREQAVWALGNIAGDSPKLRNFVLQCNALPGVIAQFNESANISMVRNSAWTLSNFCRGKPAPQWETIKPALFALSKLVMSTDEEVLTDACWALSYMSDGDNYRIQGVLDTGIAPRLVQLLAHTSSAVQVPALRTVGNIVTGSDEQTQAMINLNCLPPLVALLASSKKGIRKEACWTISNITAGTPQQIQSVIDANAFPSLVDVMHRSSYEVRKEACWTVANACSGGTTQQISTFVQIGVIVPLCDILDVPDVKTVAIALEALEGILRAGQQLAEKSVYDENPFTQLVEENGGLDRLEALQNHENEGVYSKAVEIIETYFGGEEDDENLAPNAHQESGFALPAFTGGVPTFSF